MDDLLKLELPEGLAAVTIEVEADGFAVSVSRQAQTERAAPLAERHEEAPAEKTQRVHATTAGIFSISRERSTGGSVVRGVMLGEFHTTCCGALVSRPTQAAIHEALPTVGPPT